MNASEFKALSAKFESALKAKGLRYADSWDSIGTHPLDLQLIQVADFYGKCNASQRRTLRQSMNSLVSWSFVIFVRRMALQILKTRDARWLITALRIASLENASCDFRDSIVSLVIVRAAAESVSIDPMPHFAKALAQCDTDMVSTLTNARDHRPNDVREILRDFGPPELKPKQKRKTS